MYHKEVFFVSNTVPRNSGVWQSNKWKPSSQEPNQPVLGQIVNKSKLPTPRIFERRTPKTMNNSQVSVQIILFVECLCQNFTSKSSLPHHCWTCPSCCSHLLSESTFHYQYKQNLAECLNLLYNGDNIKSNFGLYWYIYTQCVIKLN